MQDHQRYFPVLDTKNNLLPYFIATSNIQSHDPARVIHGNERVLRARLSDAAFFFDADKKISLVSRLDRLKGIVFQAKLGTLHDRAERLASLASFLAAKLDANAAQAERAGRLAKVDLVTDMVGEFPELQGVMGEYYAKHDGESVEIAVALREQYLPRFAGDMLPQTSVGQALALADRLDALVGTFGINQIPTGDKDPYGLRRAALGVLRILIEQKIDLDLQEAVAYALSTYQVTLENKETNAQVLQFMLERLRAWYQDQGVTADVFASVAALGISNPLDIDRRIKAVQAFRLLAEAEALSVANKRVSNILSKSTNCDDSQVDVALFENDAEKELAAQIEMKAGQIVTLSAEGHYERVLKELADLRKPVDDFFDHVMVMTDDMPRRENRLRLLSRLRALFLRVADIALLQ
jgi:glycyl-tRNA synthetase beta chain